MKIINTPSWIMRWGYGLTIYKLVFINKDLSDDGRAYVIKQAMMLGLLELGIEVISKVYQLPTVKSMVK